MRHTSPPTPFFASFAALLTLSLLGVGCSVDAYTLSGRVVSAPAAGADNMRQSKADKLLLAPVPYAKVRLILDPDSSLSRKELGVFACDSQGRFEVPKMNALGVEVVPYTLRVEAYGPKHKALQCDTGLPGPGHSLVLRLTRTDGQEPQRFAPSPTGAPSNDYLQQTLTESEPYLNGRK